MLRKMTGASCLPLKKGAFNFSSNRVFALLENDKGDSRVTLQHLGESFSEPLLARGQSVGTEPVGLVFLFYNRTLIRICYILSS